MGRISGLPAANNEIKQSIGIFLCVIYTILVNIIVLITSWEVHIHEVTS